MVVCKSQHRDPHAQQFDCLGIGQDLVTGSITAWSSVSVNLSTSARTGRNGWRRVKNTLGYFGEMLSIHEFANKNPSQVVYLRGVILLPGQDSNLDKENQNLLSGFFRPIAICGFFATIVYRACHLHRLPFGRR
jgi:hypothetical protein